MGELKNRARYTTTIPKEQIATIRKLSDNINIPRSRLSEEAYDDLFIKYGIEKVKILPDEE